MKITNNLGLPDAFVEAIRNDPYDKGDCDFSITELIAPPQKRTLQKIHDKYLVEDASSRRRILKGQLGHLLLERANRKELVEKRFFAIVNGHRISGQIDNLDLDTRGILTDYKFTSAWHFMANKAPKDDWVKQLNSQRWILKQNGYEKIKALQIVGILDDWMRMFTKKHKDYPCVDIAKMEIPIWSDKETLAYLEERISLHLQSRAGKQIDCTKEETFGWKCDLYCNVTKYCPQWARRSSNERTAEAK